MRRTVGLLAIGAGLLMVGVVVIPWLIYRDVQWKKNQRFMGHYDQAVDPWAEGEYQAAHAEAGARAA